MKIAIIDHSFHDTTKSSDFFINLIRRLGDVTVFLDPFWKGERPDWSSNFDSRNFDCTIIWQWSHLLREKGRDWGSRSNVIIVPMYDHVARASRSEWRSLLSSYKTICFSRALYDQARTCSHATRLFQYFPDPSDFPQLRSCAGLSGFWWNRTTDLNESLLVKICGPAIFDHITIRHIQDPGVQLHRQITKHQLPSRTVGQTSWFDSKADYLQMLSRHNVFFAPRRFEGIGLAFIEAMALGLCVVAPDTPTHNEYIINRWNGILFKDGEEEVNLKNVSSIGDAARASIFAGYLRWQASIDDLLTFVIEPPSSVGL